ncbi:MAG: sporulation protein YabP [Ruminococcus sp.]|jgi:sporulation protein YabP
MEEAEGRHGLKLDDRRTGNITGVVDVVSFDMDMILLETTRGMLTIKGEELHVSRLCLEKGEVDVEGKFRILEYSEDGEYGKKKKGSLMQRLFR